MLKITNLKQLSTLPTTTTLQEQIKAILTEPFQDDADGEHKSLTSAALIRH